MSKRRKKKRNNSLGDLQKVFALMIKSGVSMDTVEAVLTIIENLTFTDVEAAKQVLSDLTILLEGRMPKGDRDIIVSSATITILQLIANDLEELTQSRLSEKMKNGK